MWGRGEDLVEEGFGGLGTFVQFGLDPTLVQIGHTFLPTGVGDERQITDASFGNCQQAIAKGAGVNSVPDLQTSSLPSELPRRDGIDIDK